MKATHNLCTSRWTRTIISDFIRVVLLPFRHACVPPKRLELSILADMFLKHACIPFHQGGVRRRGLEPPKNYFWDSCVYQLHHLPCGHAENRTLIFALQKHCSSIKLSAQVRGWGESDSRLSPWQDATLPLSYTHVLWRERDSNSRLEDYEPSVLPLHYPDICTPCQIRTDTEWDLSSFPLPLG